jgi:hypothetical protein
MIEQEVQAAGLNKETDHGRMIEMTDIRIKRIGPIIHLIIPKLKE